MKRILSVALMCGLLAASGSGYAAVAEEKVPDYALKCTVEYKREPTADENIYGGLSINGYDYYNMRFASGDVIEYEVYLMDKIPGLGNLDVQMSKIVEVDEDGFETHEWRMLKPTKDFPDQEVIQDEQGIDMVDTADLTEVAYKKWYKRRIAVPEFFTDGFATRHWAVKTGASADMGMEFEGKTATVYYRNLRVVDKDGNVKKVIIGEGQKYIAADLFDVAGVAMKAEAVTDYPGAPEPRPTDAAAATSSVSGVSDTSAGVSGQGISSYVWMIAGGAVVIAGAAAAVIILIKRKKNGRT